jgi:beta-phosphoglucomutase
MTAGVVFDFDGVLADTEGLHFAAFRDVLAARSWTLSERDYYTRYLGFDDAGLIAAFARDQGLGLNRQELGILVHDKVSLFATRLAAGAVLYPGAVPAVSRLGAAYRLAIASGALSSEIHAILDAARLRSSFAAIVGADHVAYTKPAPDPYLAAVKAIGVAPASAVAIEDSQWGITSARTAGLKTIALTTTSARETLAHADVILTSLDEVTVELVAELIN